MAALSPILQKFEASLRKEGLTLESIKGAVTEEGLRSDLPKYGIDGEIAIGAVVKEFRESGWLQAPNSLAVQTQVQEMNPAFFQQLNETIGNTLKITVQQIENTLVKRLQLSTGSHGSTSFTEFYNAIQSKLTTQHDFWLPDAEFPRDLFNVFNLQPPTGADESAYQAHFLSQLKLLQKRSTGKGQRHGAPPIVALNVIDTHLNDYLDGRKPDISLSFDHDPTKNALYVASVGEIKPHIGDGAFRKNDIGEVLTFAERILKVQPFRRDVTVFLTDCHTIQFFRVAQGQDGADKIYQQSLQYSLISTKDQNRVVPAQGCLFLARLMWADRSILFPTAPPTTNFKVYQVDLTKYLGTGASSHVYLGSSLPKGKHATVNQHLECVVKVLSDSTITADEINNLQSLQKMGIEHVPQIIDCDSTMLLLSPVAQHFSSARCIAGDHIQQVIAVLEKAHNNGLIHRDIRPDNIMWLTDTSVLVNDWGFAIASQKPVLYRGTLHFASSEVLTSLSKRKDHMSTPQDDLQSFVRTVFAWLLPQLVAPLYQQMDPNSIKKFWEGKLAAGFWNQCCIAASQADYTKLSKQLLSFIPE